VATLPRVVPCDAVGAADERLIGCDLPDEALLTNHVAHEFLARHELRERRAPDPLAILWAADVRRVLVVADVLGDAAATARAIHMALDVVALDQALARGA
jgi:hypothetical protein